MRGLRQFSVAVAAVSLVLGTGAPVAARDMSFHQDPGARVRGGNGCTIVRNSPVAPGPAATDPDDTLATLERREAGQWVALASTPIDSGGAFEFVALTPGDYRVCATGAEGACYVGTDASPISVGVRLPTTQVSARCGLEAPTALEITVQVNNAALTARCHNCKSATTGKNNAR
jgi:hypothetical protein